MLPVFLSTCRNICLWVSAILLTLLPLVIAADFGGVLWWTHYVSSLVVLAAVLLALTGIICRSPPVHPRQFLLVLPLGVWAVYAWFQTVPLGESVIAVVSPASKQAYTEWIAPFVSATELPSHFPTSIDRVGSLHATWVLICLVGVSWASILVFCSQPRITFFLNAVALGVAAHACFGIYRLIVPDIAVWDVVMAADSFGTFVNKNNAVLLFHLGLAASLGIIAWRLAVLTGQEMDDSNFEFNDLVSLVNDPASAVGILGVLSCLAGICSTGSRGGIAATALGLLLALGWLRQRRGARTIPVVAGAVAFTALVLLLPIRFTLDRLLELRVFTTSGSQTVWSDGRLSHWRDGWETAAGHFPGGSGLASYAYAYLPFQQTSSRSWYHHADNLWLELFVEQGLCGLLFAIWIFVILIGALIRLGESVEAVDQCLRVSGWYSLGAILVSQCFDYGLIVPANLFLVTILFSIICLRDFQTRLPGFNGQLEISQHGLRPTIAASAIAVIVLITTGCAVFRLKSDAEHDALVKSAAAHFDASRFDSRALSQWTVQLREAVAEKPWAAASDMLCEYEYQKMCCEELVAQRPKTRQQAIEVYEATRPLQRRSAWRRRAPSAGTAPPKSLTTPPGKSTYQNILAASQSSLLNLPLGFSSRKWQLYLDFVHDDEQRSEAAMTQLQQFYRRNSEMLIRLATFARDSEDRERTLSLLRSALTLDPSATQTVLELTSSWDDVSPREILPDKPSVWRSATEFILEYEQQNLDLIQVCLDGLECGQCQTNADRSDCEQRSAELAFALGDRDSAFAHFREAMRLAPDDVELRLSFIDRLIQAGEREAARAQAREGRRILPDEDVFDAIIKRMANEDRNSVVP